MSDQEEDEPAAASAVTPLLFLLDGCLSNDADRVEEAVQEIRDLGVHLHQHHQLDDAHMLLNPATGALCRVLQALLAQYPEYCQYQSEHDGSLPLHFAASLGNVAAARIIWDKVSASVRSDLF